MSASASRLDPQPIRGDRVLLRPVVPADLDWLRGAATDPTVAEWWDTGMGTDWVDDLLEEDEVVPYLVEVDGTPIGYVQWSEDSDPSYRSASMDLFLVGDAQGVGYGREVLRTLVRWLIEERGHHRIEIDPSATNERAIRCYGAVGFRPIGVARRRERTVDGTWRDSLLMDLLADELR